MMGKMQMVTLCLMVESYFSFTISIYFVSYYPLHFLCNLSCCAINMVFPFSVIYLDSFVWR